jgi:hypothetical protein
MRDSTAARRATVAGSGLAWRAAGTAAAGAGDGADEADSPPPPRRPLAPRRRLPPPAMLVSVEATESWGLEADFVGTACLADATAAMGGTGGLVAEGAVSAEGAPSIDGAADVDGTAGDAEGPAEGGTGVSEMMGLADMAWRGGEVPATAREGSGDARSASSGKTYCRKPY